MPRRSLSAAADHSRASASEARPGSSTPGTTHQPSCSSRPFASVRSIDTFLLPSGWFMIMVHYNYEPSKDNHEAARKDDAGGAKFQSPRWPELPRGRGV